MRLLFTILEPRLETLIGDALSNGTFTRPPNGIHCCQKREDEIAEERVKLFDQLMSAAGGVK